MGVRKNLLYMDTGELETFFEALLRLKMNIVNPMAPSSDQFSVYDQFVWMHMVVFSVEDNLGNFFNAGHGAAVFLSWHREYLLRFEKALQREVPGQELMLPYWDWADAVFVDTLMGPNGGPAGVGGGVVQLGWFAADPPGSGSNSTSEPSWWVPGAWPTGMGWPIRPDLDDTSYGADLARHFGNGPPGDHLPTASDVNTILEQASPSNFRLVLESGGGLASSHNEVHRWISGHMGAAASPNDPIFWLHHCNIDRLWAMWQLDGNADAADFPSSLATGQQLDSEVWPWVGALVYTPTNPVVYPLPDFSMDGRPDTVTNEMTLDHRALGYSYDTEPVLGVALDRSGSMNRSTVDPLAGMAPTTKWELAVTGVENLLTDCEAAYQARESYVTAGVNTFTTVAGVNTVDPVIAGTDRGLVKNGGPYDPAAFSTAISGLAAGGGTPLAQALLDTQDGVVRPATSADPGDDLRYLAFFTDGNETAGPLLSSIAPNALPSTLIFGMGFGDGTDVDLATIDTIADKGAVAPAGLTTVYQGENIGAIDKFFANTIAHAIGYVPSSDPRFELFPGEHVHLPIQLTSADEGVMITVFRGTPDPEQWNLSLQAPTGERYSQSAPGPHFVTVVRSRHRDTMFLRRNGVADDHWVGRWQFRVSYGDSDDKTLGGGMLMPSVWDRILPASAPTPQVARFANAKVAAVKRPSPRLRPVTAPTFPTVGAPALSKADRDADGRDSAALIVNVYNRTTLKAHVRFNKGARFAGEPMEIRLKLETAPGDELTDVRLQARLVGPGPGWRDAFADFDTMPAAKRKAFLVDTKSGVRFDELGFLAGFEAAKPDAFSLRDESLELSRVDSRQFRAVVTDADVAGAYHLGVRVSGTLLRGGRREPFERIVSAQTQFGARLDPRASRPVFHWVDGEIVVRVRPKDRLGNLITPSAAGAFQLRIAGQVVHARQDHTLDGAHVLTVPFTAEKLKLRADGQGIAKGSVRLESPDGDLRLSSGDLLRVTLEGAGSVMRVVIPHWIGHRATSSAYQAGTHDALCVPIDERETFEDEAQVRGAGLEPVK